MKITPAHDHNDYGVGHRHKLPFVTMIDDSGNIKDVKDFYPEFQHFVVSFYTAIIILHKNSIIIINFNS